MESAPSETKSGVSKSWRKRVIKHGKRVKDSQCFSVFMDLISLGLYIFDVGSDIVTGVVYIIGGNTWWGVMTLAFAAVALFVTNIFGVPYLVNAKLSRGWIIVLIICFILQFGMLFMLLYRFRMHLMKNKDDDEEKDISDGILLTRLLEGFIESAPQLVLQLYIMTQMSSVRWLTVLTVISSLASLVWITRTLYKEDVLRDDIYHVNGKYRWVAAEGCLLLWPLLTVTPHVISLALFASYFTWIVFPVVAAHCLIMAVEHVVIEQKVGDLCWHIGVCILSCFPNTFILFTSRDFYLGVILFTYITQFIFDTAMFTSWFVTGGKDTVYGIPAALVVWLGFLFGIMCMGLFFYLVNGNTNEENENENDIENEQPTQEI